MGCVKSKPESSTKFPNSKKIPSLESSEEEEDDNEVLSKILIVGTKGCGKSKLIERLLFEKYTESETPEPLQGTTSEIVIRFEGKKLLCKDNMDPEEWSKNSNHIFSIREVIPFLDITFDDNFFCRTVKALVLVYDTTSAPSFEKIHKMDKIIQRLKEYTYYPRVPRFLVGLKCDLTDLRSVSKEEVKNWVDKTNAEDKDTFQNDDGIFMQWQALEVSAKDGTGSRELTELIRTSLLKALGS